MKTKLTLTIDATLVPKAKRFARARGVSLSQMVETALREMGSDNQPPFSQRWRGSFRAAERNDERYSALAGKYL